MSSPVKPPSPADRAAVAPSGPGAGGTCAAALLVPGAGHFMQGETRKAVVFFVVLVAMFTIGIASGGRVFPFQFSDPLVFLAAVAQWGMGVPRVVATLAGAGSGEVTAATYEYGNTFLIVGGLLNMLITLDAYDLSTGRKAR